jgi:hypothetical protein
LDVAGEDRRFKAVVFVGDSMEETPRDLYELASALNARKIPVFMFQEDKSDIIGEVFAEIANRSGGIHAAFDAGSAEQLAGLLRAIGSYAATSDPAKALASAKATLARIAPPKQ